MPDTDGDGLAMKTLLILMLALLAAMNVYWGVAKPESAAAYFAAAVFIGLLCITTK